jgi:CheY-like chemotaxis protein
MKTMQHLLPDFIIIDDDYINNTICLKMIELSYPGIAVKTFIDPEKGLEHLQASYTDSVANNVVLLLDINMPDPNGWEVLEKLKNLPAQVKNKLKTYILTSSVDLQDQQQAREDPQVTGYITKSLSQTKLHAIVAEYTKV